MWAKQKRFQCISVPGKRKDLRWERERRGKGSRYNKWTKRRREVIPEWWTNRSEGQCIYGGKAFLSFQVSRPSTKIVTRATSINRILHAGPAWWGYANGSDKGLIQWFLDQMYKFGYLTEVDMDHIERQMTAAEDNVLRAIIQNDWHVLKHLFSPWKTVYLDLCLEPITLLCLQKMLRITSPGFS